MQSQWIATFAWSKNRRIINMLALLLDDHLKEEACMKYINAKNLLPDALVKELQSYIQGGYLYVPHQSSAAKTMGRSVWLPTGITATKPPNRRGVSEWNLYGRVSGEILPVCIRHSENHLSEITGRGCRNVTPAFVLYTD